MIEEVRKLRENLDRLVASGEPAGPGILAALAGRAKWLEDSLASKIAPAKLVIALHDTAPGLDQASVAITGSTVKVTVLVVDHRVEARERLFVLTEDPIDNPKEIVEVVSDDAAEYLQLNPELTELITTNC